MEQATALERRNIVNGETSDACLDHALRQCLAGFLNDSALLTYPADGARRCSKSATSFFRSFNLFCTPLTPRTDRATLPAREICQLSGTDPVSVTTPRCALM